LRRVQILNELFVIQQDSKKLKNAIETGTRILQLLQKFDATVVSAYVKRFDVHHSLAQCYRRSGDFTNAFAHCDHAQTALTAVEKIASDVPAIADVLLIRRPTLDITHCGIILEANTASSQQVAKGLELLNTRCDEYRRRLTTTTTTNTCDAIIMHMYLGMLLKYRLVGRSDSLAVAKEIQTLVAAQVEKNASHAYFTESAVIQSGLDVAISLASASRKADSIAQLKSLMRLPFIIKSEHKVVSDAIQDQIRAIQ